MDLQREAGSISHPPLLDGNNYAYWKARMRAFIKSLDDRAWRAVSNGWEAPTSTDREGNVTLKPDSEWSKDEEKLANNNWKALNAIFTGVDANQFKLISNCLSAKEAWDILETHYEGTPAVRQSKLRMLTTRFENLRMQESETIADFKAKLCDIANEAFALGEIYSDTKLVQKTLCSLPERLTLRWLPLKKPKMSRLLGSMN